jgi:2-oxo-hept-3-ene-1,7-dioate hydratase
VRQFSREVAGVSVEDAYAIQTEWMCLEALAGRQLRGYKVGLTSQALQQTLRASEPDYGPLFDDTFYAPGTDIAIGNFIALRVEVESAFVLAQPLRGPGLTVAEVLRATDHVTPAFEIIDARIEQLDRETQQRRKLVDVISDFGAAAGGVLGGVRGPPEEIDLRWTGAILSRNETVEETGLGRRFRVVPQRVSPGSPMQGRAWRRDRFCWLGH